MKKSKKKVNVNKNLSKKKKGGAGYPSDEISNLESNNNNFGLNNNPSDESVVNQGIVPDTLPLPFHPSWSIPGTPSQSNPPTTPNKGLNTLANVALQDNSDKRKRRRINQGLSANAYQPHSTLANSTTTPLRTGRQHPKPVLQPRQNIKKPEDFELASRDGSEFSNTGNNQKKTNFQNNEPFIMREPSFHQLRHTIGSERRAHHYRDQEHAGREPWFQLKREASNFSFGISNKSPKKSTEGSPKKSTEGSPQQSTERSPQQSIERSPQQSIERSPQQSIERSPQQSTERSPQQSNGSPAKSKEASGLTNGQSQRNVQSPATIMVQTRRRSLEEKQIPSIDLPEWFDSTQIKNFQLMINSLFQKNATNLKLETGSFIHQTITNFSIFLISQQLSSSTFLKEHAKRRSKNSSIPGITARLGRISDLSLYTSQGQPNNKKIASTFYNSKQLLLKNLDLLVIDDDCSNNLKKLLRGLSPDEDLKTTLTFVDPDSSKSFEGFAYHFPCSVKETRYAYGKNSKEAQNVYDLLQNKKIKNEEENSKKLLNEADCLLFVTSDVNSLPELDESKEGNPENNINARLKMADTTWEGAHLSKLSGQEAYCSDVLTSYVLQILDEKIKNEDVSNESFSFGFGRLLSLLFSETFPATKGFNEEHETLLRVPCVDGPIIAHMFSTEFNSDTNQQVYIPELIRLVLSSLVNKLSRTIGIEPVKTVKELLEIENSFLESKKSNFPFTYPTKKSRNVRNELSKVEIDEKTMGRKLIGSNTSRFDLNLKSARTAFDKLIKEGGILMKALENENENENNLKVIDKIPILIRSLWLEDKNQEGSLRKSIKSVLPKLLEKLTDLKEKYSSEYAYTTILKEKLEISMPKRKDKRDTLLNRPSQMAENYFELIELSKGTTLIEDSFKFYNAILAMTNLEAALFNYFMINIQKNREKKKPPIPPSFGVPYTSKAPRVLKAGVGAKKRMVSKTGNANQRKLMENLFKKYGNIKSQNELKKNFQTITNEIDEKTKKKDEKTKKDLYNGYFEKQLEGSGQCGLHTLNNVFGGPLFTEEDMKNALLTFLFEQKMEQSGEVANSHMSDDGWYSEAILTMALRKKDNLYMMDVDRPLTPDKLEERISKSGFVGIVVNIDNIHWVAIRVVENEFWLLDSLKTPQNITPEMVKEYITENKNAFIVRRVGSNN